MKTMKVEFPLIKGKDTRMISMYIPSYEQLSDIFDGMPTEKDGKEIEGIEKKGYVNYYYTGIESFFKNLLVDNEDLKEVMDYFRVKNNLPIYIQFKVKLLEVTKEAFKFRTTM